MTPNGCWVVCIVILRDSTSKTEALDLVKWMIIIHEWGIAACDLDRCRWGYKYRQVEMVFFDKVSAVDVWSCDRVPIACATGCSTGYGQPRTCWRFSIMCFWPGHTFGVPHKELGGFVCVASPLVLPWPSSTWVRGNWMNVWPLFGYHRQQSSVCSGVRLTRQHHVGENPNRLTPLSL